ncbi:DUF721 domain-containing protein [Nocardioides litoris]|uniref:DUF721 domain-containing protein n=1 Tax=Nocardioides litoris TaxID=1926648 RepID=UPI0011235EBA|nr:DciA family protein [Nocardioides litoris]
MSSDDPSAAPTPPTPRDEPHRDDGLDLARQAVRATAGTTPAARRPRRGGGRRTTGGAGAGTTGGRLSGAHPDERDPQLLGGEVGKLVDRHGWELELRVRGVFARWPELVGDDVAAHCTPESFADGRLVVRTDSTAWATQLKLLLPAILRRLNEDLGEGTVTLVEVLGPHLPTWKKGARSTRDSRGPRDTYG